MNSQDQTKHLQRFVDEINKLDRVRDENFWDTFPELMEMKKYGTT
jgi:hypothetical protein